MRLPLPAARPALASVVLALAFAGAGLGACGDDGGKSEPDVISGDTDAAVTPLPDFDVAIVASALSGNAPLTVSFSVDVSGEVSPAQLSYEWIVDGDVAGQTPALEFPFYRAGSATVTMRAEYEALDGRKAVAEDSVVVRIQGCADLTFDRLSLEPPVEVAPGDAMVLRNTRMLNNGDTIEGGVDVLVALSTNEVFDDGDLVMERWTEDGMPSGLLGQVFIDYSGREIPIGEDVEEGNYFVFIVADPDNTVNECQETNNVERSTNNVEIDPDAAFKPDLALTEVSLPTGLVVNAGESINYNFTISNQGPGEATNFRFGFWLSTDQTLSPDTDIVVAAPTDDNSKVNSLGPATSLPFFKSYRIPDDLPDGQYWLIGEVDATEQVGEEDETNNIGVSATPLLMEYEAPTCFDLAFEDIVVEPLSTYWDGSVQLTVTVANPGTEATPEDWLLRGFLSQQQSLNPTTARVVGNWRLPTIPPGESRTISRIIAIDDDLPILPHYVAALLDPDGEIEECDEGNNAAQFGEAITIKPTASVDIGVSEITYHPSTVVAGDNVSLDFSVTNSGTSGATAFEVGYVLSPDPTISRSGVNSGADILLGRELIGSVAANGAVTMDGTQVTIPIALDHTVDTYYIGVIADLGLIVAQDGSQSNNVQVAEQVLTVTNAQGGCYEDDNEDDDSLASATAVGAGTVADRGSCGDADWYTVDVPAGHSLVVDVAAAPILAIEEVPSELVVELRDPTSTVVARSDRDGGADSVRAYAVAAAGAYSVSVAGRSAAVRAAYDLTVDVKPPPAGIDLLAYGVQASPRVAYPGGTMNVGWREVNVGQTPAGAHKVRVWASTDATLDLGIDTPVAEVDVAAVGALTEAEGSVDFVLPSALAGGDYRLIVVVDADDDLVEADDGNNVAVSDPIFLDVSQSCADDDLEPNDELRIATPLTLTDGFATVTDAVICPDLPDWYAVEVAAGERLIAEVDYTYESSRGLIELRLWDPSEEAQLLIDASSSGSEIDLPWAWLPGTYYLGVANRAQGSNVGPYTYSLSVSVAPGPAENMCTADSYEDNNAFSRSKPAGCGLLSATLCDADADYYLLEAVEGQEVRLTMSHPSAETRTRLYDEEGGNAIKTRTGNGTLSHTPAEDGFLWVRVEPRNGPLSMTTFPYELAIEGIAGIDLSVAGPELAVSSVLQGEDVLAEFGVVNGCTDGADPFIATIWLSADPFLDATDADLAEVAFTDGLVAGETITVQTKVTVPITTSAGDYFLLVEADSGLAVPESNEQNNVAAAPLNVAAVCLPDAYEPNNFLTVPGDAPLISPPGATGLAICPADQDWFRVTATTGSTLTVRALFSHGEGDLDLRLYDPNNSLVVPVASSTSDTDDEEIVYAVPVGGTFIVRVAGFGGASAAYDLEVDVTE